MKDILGIDISLNPGGVASALANDGSKIVLTGAGAFVAPAGGSGRTSAVTGGGTWETFNASNVSTGNGTYWVTGLVGWNQAPGFFRPPLLDNIGNTAEASAGCCPAHSILGWGARDSCRQLPPLRRNAGNDAPARIRFIDGRVVFELVGQVTNSATPAPLGSSNQYGYPALAAVRGIDNVFGGNPRN